jgi:hypothetical protein
VTLVAFVGALKVTLQIGQRSDTRTIASVELFTNGAHQTQRTRLRPCMSTPVYFAFARLHSGTFYNRVCE